MDIAEVVIIPVSSSLTAVAIVAVQKLFGLSLLAACLIGTPTALLLDMLLVALLSSLGGKKSG